jgi:F-type H+-transporting ATPase subunit gamma
MANFREYSARLASMSGMRRVTATMKMVAASHLHRAQTELRLPEPFAAALWALVPIASRPSFASHRICLPPPEKDTRILLLVICSNRGLCGAFNNAVVREVRRWLKEQVTTREARVEAVYVGQKGYAALWREISPSMKTVDVSVHPQAKETALISKHAMDAFLAKRYDEVWIAGNRFVSAMTHEPRIERLLPYQKRPQIARPDKVPDVAPRLIEPDDERMLEAISRQWVHLGVYDALMNSVASEHAARVMAMENATVNLRRMEKELILLRNRARQAAITNELTEIVSGAESLG